MEVGHTICSPMVPSTIVSWHQPSQKTWTLALATLGHTDVPWVASARVHVFWPQNEIPPKFQNGLLVPRKVGGYKLFTPKKCFLLCSMLTLVPRKAIRRIRTIIPKESLLFHVKVSVVNCVVRPLLFEGLMNVCSMEARSTLSVGAVFSLAKMLQMITFKNSL